MLEIWTNDLYAFEAIFMFFEVYVGDGIKVAITLAKPGSATIPTHFDGSM